MVSHAMAMLRSVERQYASKGDIPFEKILADFDVQGDEEALAELIEADGRARLTLGKHVDLDRYLQAIPDLDARPVPLDAAIDVTLRSLSASSHPTDEAIQTLVENYPRLEESIREAATLAQALWSTTGIRSRLESPVRSLPADFGPRLTSGEKRYQLQKLLGKGGWGEVYLATDRQMSDAGHDATAAIKVLTGGDRGPWARQRLIDEATKARRVEHPNVVRVLDRGVSDDDEDFIVYEHVAGGDLGDWLQGRTLTARQAATLVAKIARGLQAAHAAGLVHCDLKPGNVLVAADGEPRIADFGIAIRSGEGIDAIRERDDGRPVGNIAFISPEQFRMEEGSLSVASDIYALGGMLYFLVTREFPNGGSAEEIALNHDTVDGRKAPPAMRRPARGADRDLEAICQRSMALRPQDRYASAAALADDLEAWVRREPIRWLKPSPARVGWLLWRRRPLLMTVLVVASVGVLAATSSAVRSARIAAQKASETQLIVARTAALKELTSNVGNVVKKMRTTGFDQDALPAAVALEWLNDNYVFGSLLDPAERWKSRIDVVRQLLSNREQAGLGDSVETLIWETNLGFWLLNAGQNEEAESVLNDNLAKFRRAVVRSDEPWFRMVEQIRAVAVIRRLGAKAAHASLSSEDRGELETAAGLAEQSLARPRESDEGTVQQLMLAAVMEADRPGMLNRKAPYKNAHARIFAREFMNPSANTNSPTAKALREAGEAKPAP